MPTSGHKGRVLCVTSNFPRWAGDSTTPFVLNMAEDLQAQGWQVDVLAPHAPGAAKRETLRGVNVERFQYTLPQSWQTVCYQGGAMVNLRKRPAEKLKLPMLVGAELVAVARRLLTRNYDILNSHWILPQGFTGMLATRLSRVPHVITVHGGDIFSLQSPLMTRLKRAALQSAQAVTVNSSFTESATLGVEPRINALHRIPMGVDASPLSAAETTLAEQLRARYRHGNGPLLIFLGRLVEEKGCEDAIRALNLLADSNPDARLLVLGEGQDRPALEQLTHSLELQDKVHFVGWVDPGEVRAYLAAADCFLGPSRTARDGWVEAQGLTFLEAMAAGTPVVASRLGGIVDSVRHDHTGLLVDEQSPQQLAAAIRRLAVQPQLADTFADNARDMLQQTFSRQASAAAFSELFEQLRDRNREKPA
jgi:phosphatidyl-myo-inositol dimannoside synthase